MDISVLYYAIFHMNVVKTQQAVYIIPVILTSASALNGALLGSISNEAFLLMEVASKLLPLATTSVPSSISIRNGEPAKCI